MRLGTCNLLRFAAANLEAFTALLALHDNDDCMRSLEDDERDTRRVKCTIVDTHGEFRGRRHSHTQLPVSVALRYEQRRRKVKRVIESRREADKIRTTVCCVVQVRGHDGGGYRADLCPCHRPPPHHPSPPLTV